MAVPWIAAYQGNDGWGQGEVLADKKFYTDTFTDAWKSLKLSRKLDAFTLRLEYE